MSSKHTFRQLSFGDRPKRIDLHGDKTKKVEPSGHVITFPGGSIELTRTTDGDYWVHCHVNRQWACDCCQEGHHEAHGEVIDSRVIRRPIGGRASHPEDVQGAEDIEQFALLVRPVRSGSES